MTAQLQEILDAARHAAADPTSDEDAASLALQARSMARRLLARRWRPYPWQHPHHHPEGWVSSRNGKGHPHGVCDDGCYALPVAAIPTQGTWLEYGGRGTGKTEGASHYVNAHCEGPACDGRVPGGHRILIIGPTQPDAVKACVTGVSGLQIINPDIGISTGREGTVVRWPNGALGYIIGAHGPDDVERARAAGNVCLIWKEEFAAQRFGPQISDIAAFGLRLGPHPHSVASTTPKPRPELAKLRDSARTIITRGRTRDASRLPTELRRVYEEQYGGTTLGRQELDAEDLDDVEGALWVHHRPDEVDGQPNKDHRPGIENDRITDPAAVGWYSHDPLVPPVIGRVMMHRVVIAVDPPGGRTECGITVEASAGGHGYTLADLSIAGPPDTWARVVLRAYLDYGAEGIAAEHTYGGDMVADVISTRVELMRRDGEWSDNLSAPPIFKVPTKVGKRLRAEPVQGLYQQHRQHHVGVLPGLEGEMTTWVPGDTESPNRLDAHVHGQTYLLIRAGAGQVSNPARSATRIPGR